MTLVHHELCFGCGRTNLFGLLLDADFLAPGAVAGRCFIKQDHQGPEPGVAHPGILVTALIEAMSLACGKDVRLQALELKIDGPVQVGEYLEVQARVEDRGAQELCATARAGTGTDYVCSASGSFRAWPSTSRTRS